MRHLKDLLYQTFSKVHIDVAFFTIVCFSTFFSPKKVEQKSSRQTQTLRVFCLACAQQYQTLFCIIHLVLAKHRVFLQTQTFSKPHVR